MQYHLNGFRPGNLQLSESIRQAGPVPDPGNLPAETDVLIVGCGPAGLTLARQLAEFSDIHTTIIDQKAGPILFGQADGVSCRTIEIMEAFNSSELVLKEAYWLNQTAFWDPDATNSANITRTRKVPDARIGLSEFPHVVLNQARVHDLLLEGMQRSPTQIQPSYSRRLTNLSIDSENAQSSDFQPSLHPLTATVESLDNDHQGQAEVIKARYVVGCDGARSDVRKYLNVPLRGDSANKAWGVMDALVATDFPDIRVKTFIQSASNGSIMIVPREGGYLVRFYVELDQLQRDQRVTSLSVELDELIAAAQTILQPYRLEVKEVPWWSVYEIGQRVADAFDDLPADAPDTLRARAFIAGDACHTHSPKAGQGMNVSIHDAFNLGWKLASVLLEQSHPKLLRTYSLERRKIAQDLIALDRTFAKLVAGEPAGSDTAGEDNNGTSDIQRYLAKQNGFIAGTGIQYQPSFITGDSAYQQLATGFEVGTRFHSAKVSRLADGRQLHLGHQNKADGRWRIFIFNGDQTPTETDSEFLALVQFLASSKESPVVKYTPESKNIDSLIDVYAIFQHTQNPPIETLPDFLWPTKGSLELRDYEKVFCAIAEKDIYELRHINRSSGCVVVVRPDQYIAQVLALTAHSELSAFFDGFMIAAKERETSTLK